MRCEGTAWLKVSRSVAAVRFDRVRVFLSRQGLFLESESAARLVYKASYEGEFRRGNFGS
jgi:hypothetical protein